VYNLRLGIDINCWSQWPHGRRCAFNAAC